MRELNSQGRNILYGLLYQAKVKQEQLDDLIKTTAMLLEVEEEGSGYYGVLSDNIYELNRSSVDSVISNIETWLQDQ